MLQRKSTYSNQASQIKSQEENIKSLKGDIETLRRQLLQSDIRYENIKNSLPLKKEVMETQAQQKLLRDAEKKQIELNLKESKLKKREDKLKESKATDKKTDNKS